MMSRLAVAAGLAFWALAADAAPPNASRVLEDQAVLAKSQAAIGRRIGGFSFEDADGTPFRLEALRGRPVVLNVVYTSCYQVCPTVTQSLASAVEAADRTFGPGRFVVTTIGFDTAADTPDRMGAYAKMHGIDRKGWYFLSADPETMFRFTDAIGFSYATSSKGFDHTTQTTVLDADGRVYRQVYGDQLRVKDVMAPLKQLLIGGIPEERGLSSFAERFRLLCTIYDPAADRYRFSYAMLFGFLIGFACLAGTAYVVLRGWWRVRGQA